ncbi:hypothetical protein Val02_82310 [Virgisporangium aliadipatigenens]|uniref:Uncharacterized protein n=1 Tax=Virgisporangium aliadipatigenens TaxID=741659 RepID=A0A8J3YWY8_9ACTN|nr:hypothetical protein [Virgisporangium aliadipatigenens]GIJ51345.1 hypothetical protein Val02_82310 [Virgisporangium aliadipatigenens]
MLLLRIGTFLSRLAARQPARPALADGDYTAGSPLLERSGRVPLDDAPDPEQERDRVAQLLARLHEEWR